jgi:hypothetical protein
MCRAKYLYRLGKNDIEFGSCFKDSLILFVIVSINTFWLSVIAVPIAIMIPVVCWEKNEIGLEVE